MCMSDTRNCMYLLSFYKIYVQCVQCTACTNTVGTDALPGREGGTWFGMSSKFAKIGVLLNITVVAIDSRKRPRGNLVTDYLQTDLGAGGYIKAVAQQQKQFNLFNLVLLERRFVQFLFSIILTGCMVC